MSVKAAQATSPKIALLAVLTAVLVGPTSPSAGTDSGVAASIWSLKGNRGTDPEVDFLGTTDNRPMVLKTNSTPVLRLDSDGRVEVQNALVVHGTATAAAVNVTGTTRTGVLEITGGDLAEPFTISGSSEILPGAVVIIDDKHPGQLTLTDEPYDHRVAGVISGAGGIKAGVIMYRDGASQKAEYLALAGRVYAQADACNGAIAPGDLLTTSAIPGHVMKVTDYQRVHGAVVGKAISSLNKGDGLVLMLVSLQ